MKISNNSGHDEARPSNRNKTMEGHAPSWPINNYSSKPPVSLTLIPPSPVTDKIILDIRGAVWNDSNDIKDYKVSLSITGKKGKIILLEQTLSIPSMSSKGISFRIPTSGHVGNNEVALSVVSGKETLQVSKPVQIIASDVRSTKRIDGAWAGIYHWSEDEGRLWNSEIKKMTDDQWRELVRGMHGIGMDIMVIQESIRNQEYCGDHNIEKDGYHGKAFYPSKLFPDRMPITAKDPIEAILSEADKHGMSIFMGIGMYAWFDFSSGSLEWHKKVAKELWDIYGHHPSFYGWYVGEEAPGSLDNWSSEPADKVQRRKDIIPFFRDFKAYCLTLAPDKPVMLAPNCHSVPAGKDTYPELLKYLDILCPFGFHRMPDGDITGEEAATILQKLCDDAGAHLWMDMEVFLFDPKNALYPRPIEGLISDAIRFPNFEKIICYQYPGLLNAPDASIKPGGPDTVKLYSDYFNYFRKLTSEFLP